MKKLNMISTIFIFIFFACANVVQAMNLPDFTELAEKAGQSVVNISTEKNTSSQQQDFMQDFMPNLPPGFEGFEGLFEQFQPFQGFRQRRPSQSSLGTGFIISADGYIATNYHVVSGADTINVNLQGATGKSDAINATLVGYDEESDIAILKVEVDEDLPFLTFADSNQARVGEWVIAIGNPFGLEHTVTAGILSAKGRNINSGPFDNFLQTDASINPGNSGGPLLNMNGEVVGINTAIIASGQGIGFAIPSSMASNIAEQLMTGQKVVRGWLGVVMQDVDETTALALELEKAHGALVTDVFDNDPADNAGIKAGDVIIAINSIEIKDSSELLHLIANEQPETDVQVTVWRSGEEMQFTVTLGERNSEQRSSQDGRTTNPTQEHDNASLGIAVRPLTAEEASEFEIGENQGLLVVEVEQGPAEEVGIRRGDIILSANMIDVNSPAQLMEILEEARQRGAIMLQINRRGEVAFFAVPLSE